MQPLVYCQKGNTIASNKYTLATLQYNGYLLDRKLFLILGATGSLNPASAETFLLLTLSFFGNRNLSPWYRNH